MNKKKILLIFSFTLLSFVYAQVPEKSKELEIRSADENEYVYRKNMRVNKKNNIPVALYNVGQPVTPGQPREMASEYLQLNTKLLSGTISSKDLVYTTTKETPAGYRVRYKQYVEGYPLYDADIVVSINKKNEVVFVMNEQKPVQELTNLLVLSAEDAKKIACDYLNISNEQEYIRAEVYIFEAVAEFRYVYQIIVIPAEGPPGDWEFLIDAQSGEILKAVNNILHYGNSEYTNGTAWVYDPDVVARTGLNYGEAGIEDNLDADSDILTSNLVSVNLLDITYIESQGHYLLNGPYAQIIDFEEPRTGLHYHTSPDFNFTRSHDNFEAVNIYYHIDKSMRYVNDTLGYNVMPTAYDGGVKYDPHADEGEVNAHYASSFDILTFGSPQKHVDLGEDYAVILHELGHGIHDWISDGNWSRKEGLSEGSGDYWAQSYTRSLGYSRPGDPNYDYFVQWGGQPAWNGPCLRRTNYEGTYPDDLTGDIHRDGQMWSSSLMSIYDQIGKEVTDRLFLETLSMLGRSANQRDAANAFIQADKDLYDGIHLNVITDVFIARGYLESIITFESNIQTGHAPLAVQFSDSLINNQVAIKAWEWDFDNDGNPDRVGSNPTWIYRAPGKYTVSLKATDGVNVYEFSRDEYINIFDGESALKFLGRNSYVNCGNDESLEFTDVLTFEAWIKPESWGPFKRGDGRIFSKISNSLTLIGEEDRYYSEKSVLLTMNFADGNYGYFNTGPNTIELNEWQHIVVTYNSELKEVKIYINEKDMPLIIKSKSMGKIANNVNYPMIIGNNINGTRGFEGIIDEIRVWNRALSLKEITSEKGNISEPVDQGLILQLNMNEGNGTKLLDGSGYRQICITSGTRWVAGYKPSESLDIVYQDLRTELQDFKLHPNRPNPFNPNTVISYQIPFTSHVELIIYNLLGQKIATLVSEKQQAGLYQVEWDASMYSSGTYVYILKTEKFHEAKKMILLK